MKKNTNETVEKELKKVKEKQTKSRKSSIESVSALKKDTSLSTTKKKTEKKSAPKKADESKKKTSATTKKSSTNLNLDTKAKKETLKKTNKIESLEVKPALEVKVTKNLKDKEKSSEKKTAGKKANVRASKTQKTEQAKEGTRTKRVVKKNETVSNEKGLKVKYEKVVKDTSPKKLEESKINNKLDYASETSQKIEVRKENDVAKASIIKVLYVASECQPFIATGGLGDVAGSLPKEIAKFNEVDIRVILPLYANIKEKYINELEFIGNFTTHLAWRQEYCGIFKLKRDGVIYYFVDNERYFKREKPYGFYDDGERFAYFCKSVVEGLSTIDFFPDIIHCNDWQSALVSTYIKTGNWSDLRYYNIKNIYTIHNVEYQGIYGMENLSDLFGVDYKFKNFVEYNGDINLTKAAIQFSDKFTTVSESYCDNLKESYCSNGLNYIIIRNDYKLCGIMNGIDYDFYNPKTDKCIYYNYDINSIEGKAKNKLALQKDLALKENKDIPVLAIVSRLVPHKGMGLLMRVLDKVLEQDVQLIVVGTGDRRYIDYFNDLQFRHQDKVRVFVDRYYNDMARKAYASSDIFLMPSIIEPCGISQMIASRYGTIPIVREVGGLKDSIKDFGCVEGGNGYTFTNYKAEDFYYQISKALSDFKDKKLFESQIRLVMSKDFSFKNSARKYIDLYKSLVR